MDFVRETESLLETQDLAFNLASFLSPGDLLSLTGDLGAGKTAFTQGLAKGLGIKDNITSPTFTLIKEYQGRLPLYHFDVFRLKSEQDLFDLGFEDYFYGAGVTVVEWGDKVSSLLPDEFLEIEFHRMDKETQRKLIIQPKGEGWKSKTKEWLAGC